MNPENWQRAVKFLQGSEKVLGNAGASGFYRNAYLDPKVK